MPSRRLQGVGQGALCLQEGGWQTSSSPTPWPTPGPPSLPTHLLRWRWIITFFRGIVMCNKKPHRAGRAHFLENEPKTLVLLYPWPTLLCFKGEDRLANCPKVGKCLLILMEFVTLAGFYRGAILTNLLSGSLIHQSQGQTWLILHGEAQRYVSITDAPSLETSLIWVLHIVTEKDECSLVRVGAARAICLFRLNMWLLS